jgi:hypothetical protein
MLQEVKKLLLLLPADYFEAHQKNQAGVHDMVR